MKTLQNKRQVTRVWLMAELNSRLKQAGRNGAVCGGCRIRNLVQQPPGASANWTVELFESKCGDACLDSLREIVVHAQQRCEVAW